ncbi:Uncharacterized protein APZ42_012459 [Daphnia magna]|uniref:Uncharacterized protein n=1 Tax=Daphnia magna TaxID=35525 RepID=A0A162RTR1_9CRUS|nr:Uncharacterized protein APZ42_012459 [Daphnia magna]
MKCLLRGTTKLARVLGPYLAKEDPNWGMKKGLRKEESRLSYLYTTVDACLEIPTCQE